VFTCDTCPLYLHILKLNAFLLWISIDILTHVDDDFPTQTAAAALSIELFHEALRSLSNTPIAISDGEVDRLLFSNKSTRAFHGNTAPNRCISRTAPDSPVAEATPQQGCGVAIMVGPDKYATEVETTSRAITVRGPHVALVIVGDDVIYGTAHITSWVHYGSCLVLSDSGSAISCINASIFETIRRSCPGTSIAPSDKSFTQR
jgi:hypothetical protein